jgi:hypothetical protein
MGMKHSAEPYKHSHINIHYGITIITSVPLLKRHASQIAETHRSQLGEGKKSAGRGISCARSLIRDDVTKMSWHLQSTFLAISSVTHTKALLHVAVEFRSEA